MVDGGLPMGAVVHIAMGSVECSFLAKTLAATIIIAITMNTTLILALSQI